MKTRLLLCALPLLFTAACAPNNTNDEEAAPATSPYLAKEVVGVHLLSTDTHYGKLAEALPEEFVKNTFKVSEETEMEIESTSDGVEYSWGKNHVIVKMAGERPFASIFTAEATFDRMFRPSPAEAAVVEAAPALPVSESATEAEKPAAAPAPAPAHAEAAPGHSAEHGAPSETAVAAHPTKPVEGEAVANLGDKAVWEPATETLHVLLSNHILHLKVETADSEAVKKQRAVSMAQVLFFNLTGLNVGKVGN